MTADFSHQFGCWFYRCIFGCFEYDFESLRSAQEAEAGHDCQFRPSAA